MLKLQAHQYFSGPVLLGLLGLLLPVQIQAATIRVARDGSGDFLTLQEALDVAASGDIVSIAPGVYDQVFTRSSGTATFQIHGWVSQAQLTIVGDDRDTVFIGPAIPPAGLPQNRPLGIGTSLTTKLTIQSVTVRNVSNGVQCEGLQLSVLDCQFSSNDASIQAGARDGIEITNCSFSNSDQCGVCLSDVVGASSAIVTGCSFTEDNIAIDSQVPNTVISECTVVGGDVGIQSTFGADTTVMNCRLDGQSGYGLHVAQGAVLRLYNNVVAGLPGGCLSIVGTVTGTSNEFHGGTYATIRCTTSSSVQSFHDNHLLNGGGWTIAGPIGTPSTPFVLDFTSNYWGTADPAQIAAWINDNRDHAGIKFLIDFEPYHTEPVGSDTRSFGELRTLFEGR